MRKLEKGKASQQNDEAAFRFDSKASIQWTREYLFQIPDERELLSPRLWYWCQQILSMSLLWASGGGHQASYVHYTTSDLHHFVYWKNKNAYLRRLIRKSNESNLIAHHQHDLSYFGINGVSRQNQKTCPDSIRTLALVWNGSQQNNVRRYYCLQEAASQKSQGTSATYDACDEKDDDLQPTTQKTLTSSDSSKTCQPLRLRWWGWDQI